MSVAFAIALSAWMLAAPSVAADSIDPKADAVIARTRNTTATYSLYLWNKVTFPNEKPKQEWSAEFHSGRKHRVESPSARAVADCETGTGAYLNLETGEKSTESWVAKAACGIHSVLPVISSVSLGITKTPFGNADRVQVTDERNVRTYEVLNDGALVSAIYTDHDSGQWIENTAIGHASDLPAPDMFTEESLARSVVPASFKVAPKQRDTEPLKFSGNAVSQ